MSKITKKQIKQEFSELKAILKAAEVYADVNMEYSDLVKAQFCLSALEIKSKQVETLIRQLEVQQKQEQIRIA